MPKITGFMALNMLEIVVNKVGHEHVYVNESGVQAGVIGTGGMMASCSYLHKQGDGYVAGCIVGHVAKHAGVPDRILRSEENNTSDSLVDAINAEPGVDLEFTEGASIALRAAQFCQDRGDTWGKALEEAKRRYLDWKMYSNFRTQSEILDDFADQF